MLSIYSKSVKTALGKFAYSVDWEDTVRKFKPNISSSYFNFHVTVLINEEYYKL